jgi:hypothetical protein
MELRILAKKARAVARTFVANQTAAAAKRCRDGKDLNGFGFLSNMSKWFRKP